LIGVAECQYRVRHAVGAAATVAREWHLKVLVLGGTDSIGAPVVEALLWPLVHRRDIGTLYALALERGAPAKSYNGSALDSIPVGVIARAMARRAGLELPPLIRSADEAAAQSGEWARGYAIDQRMSGDKARRELGCRSLYTDPLADVS
jgi:hypothetical protein